MLICIHNKIQDKGLAQGPAHLKCIYHQEATDRIGRKVGSAPPSCQSDLCPTDRNTGGKGVLFSTSGLLLPFLLLSPEVLVHFPLNVFSAFECICRHEEPHSGLGSEVKEQYRRPAHRHHVDLSLASWSSSNHLCDSVFSPPSPPSPDSSSSPPSASSSSSFSSPPSPSFLSSSSYPSSPSLPPSPSFASLFDKHAQLIVMQGTSIQ